MKMLTSSDREKIKEVLEAHLGLHNADGTPTEDYDGGIIMGIGRR